MPSHEVRCCGGRQPPKDFVVSGNAFTDGAMRGRAPVAARRAGCAWVIVDDAGDVIFSLHGPCPDPFPTAFRAELRAVCELLVMVTPPITIWIDNKEVLDGIAKGREWCCSSARQAADLWRTFWHKMSDIGDEEVTFVKTKGHASDGDVQSGRSTLFQKRGNDNADHFAGRGVDIALGMSPNTHSIAAYKEAIDWYKWLTLLCSNWPRDVDPRPRDQNGSSAAKAAGALMPQGKRPRGTSSSGRKHEGKMAVRTAWQMEPDRLAAIDRAASAGGMCSNVSSGASSGAGGGTSGSSGGPEALETLVQSKQLHSSHSMRITGNLLWCNNCGCYGQARFKALKEDCRGGATARARAGQLAQLRLGRHPLSGEPLGKVLTSAIRVTKPGAAGRGGATTSAGDLEKFVHALQRPVGRVLGTALGCMV